MVYFGSIRILRCKTFYTVKTLKAMLVKPKRYCKLCKTEITGRRSKIFCDLYCKAEYHNRVNKVNKIATEKIDKILHRNRAILL